MNRNTQRCGAWTYELLEDGTAALTAYDGPGGAVTIPPVVNGRRVACLGEMLFREDLLPFPEDGSPGERSLAAVIIPEGVREIGRKAFFCCRNLRRVTLPRSLRSLGEDAFSFCESLQEVSVPDAVQQLPDGAFEGCISLQTARLPRGLESIGERAFAGCWALEECRLPEGLETIGDCAFDCCGSLEIPTLPAGVLCVGRDAFAGCMPARRGQAGWKFRSEREFSRRYPLKWEIAGLKSKKEVRGMNRRGYRLMPVRLRASGRFRYVVRRGGASLRKWNVSRDELRLPERIGGRTLSAIGREAFYQTNARHIVLPDTVCTIGERAFAQSPCLQAVRIPAGVQLIDRSAFGGSENVVLEVEPGSYAERYARVMGIPSVCGEADWGMLRRRSLRWGDWVCRLTEEGTIVLREYCGCDAAVDVPARVDGFPVVRLDDWCFDSCAFLQEVNIPEGVTSLGRECFARCVQLRSVSLPESLQWLGTGAFANCTRLEWLGIPDRVRSIPALCFARSGLRLLHLPDKLRHIGVGAFAACGSLREAVLPPQTQKVESDAFRDCDELQRLELNEGLTWVGGDALRGCSELWMPAIPASLNPACWKEFQDCIGAPEDLGDDD